MENVVYLLGAGFSAPLELPLINNFLMKAKDMFAVDSKQFKHFSSIFERIDRMHVAKSYYRTDLFNIEEILSILEMTERVAGSDLRGFIQFIKEVIVHYTPNVPKLNLHYSNWWNVPFKEASVWTPYFTFVAHLLGLRCRSVEISDHGRMIKQLHSRPLELPKTKYGVISLNYDLVLEKMEELLVNDKPLPDACRFKTDFQMPMEANDVLLTKLHGSVDRNNIIAPTWNKGLSVDMVSTWNAALNLLMQANHIRILGYSLPTADAYIKYLLKAAVINSSHLKRIDVLCFDPDGAVQKRYAEFIEFNYYRFRSFKTETYLDELHAIIDRTGSVNGNEVYYEMLEKSHEAIFTRPLS